MGSSVVNRTANKAGAQLLAPFRLWMEELSGDCLSSVAQSRRRTINRAPQSIHHPPVASDDKLKTVANFCSSSPARQFVASSTAQWPTGKLRPSTAGAILSPAARPSSCRLHQPLDLHPLV